MRALLGTFALAFVGTILAAQQPPAAPPPDLRDLDLTPLLQVTRTRTRQWVAGTLPPPGSRDDHSIAITRGGAVMAFLTGSRQSTDPPIEVFHRWVRGRATPDQMDRLRLHVLGPLRGTPDCVLRNDSSHQDWAFDGTSTYVRFDGAGRDEIFILHRDRGTGPVALPKCPVRVYDVDVELDLWLSSVMSNDDTEILLNR
jgi:hypothetical protein